MVLSAAERQKRRRQKLKFAEHVSVRLDMPGRLHAKLKKQAMIAESDFHKFLLAKLSKPSR